MPVNKKPRILTITQSTYDGIVYNVETIKTMLDGEIDALHFDEAWLPHAAFHMISTRICTPSAVTARRQKKSMIFSTQSTHKLLAGLSQASQILVKESEEVRLDHNIFNESFLMHTSTSPQYAIIASCDEAAAMMEPPGGTALVVGIHSRSAGFQTRHEENRKGMGKRLVVRSLGPGQFRGKRASAGAMTRS